MKKFGTTLLMAGLLMALPNPTFAKSSINVQVDNQTVTFSDAQPEVVNDRTMVPIRTVVEAMGAKVTMSNGNYFTITKGNTTIQITWNSTHAIVNGKEVELPVPAYIKNERTYVPLRFISESFGDEVFYDGSTNTAQIATVNEGTIGVSLNGNSVSFPDAKPLVLLGTTMVPIATISQQMGAQVTLSDSDYFTIQKDHTKIKIVWNSKTASINGQEVTLPVPAFVRDGRTYVPLRFINEAFSAKVDWNAQANVAEVTTSDNSANNPALAFSVISDIHVKTGDPDAKKNFEDALTDINQSTASDALVIDGDLGNGSVNDYNLLNSIMNQYSHPQTYFAMGNHEYYNAWFNSQGTYSPKNFPNGITEQTAINRFLDLTGQGKVYYDEWVKGYHFVFLGSEESRITNMNNGDNAYLSQAQLSWLSNMLNEGNSNQPVFVFLHQPLPNTVSRTKTWDYQNAVIQAQQLRSILSQHPNVVLFSAHTHARLTEPDAYANVGFSVFNTSSVVDGGEGLYVQVFGNKVVVEGRDYEDQVWIPQENYTVGQ